MNKDQLNYSLENLITSADDLYRATEAERQKNLRPVIEDIMSRISRTMEDSESVLVYNYNRYGTDKNTLNAQQVAYLIQIFAKKGYTIEDRHYEGDYRDPSYYQLQISWVNRV